MFQLIKGLIFLITIILIFICGWNAENLLTFDLLQQNNAAEKLEFLNLSKEKTLILGVTAVVFLFIATGTLLVGYFTSRGLKKKLNDEKERVNKQYLAYTSLESKFKEANENKHYIDESVSDLRKMIAALKTEAPILLSNNDMLKQVLAKLPEEPVNIEKIAIDIDLANTIENIDKAYQDNNIDHRKNQAVKLLLKLSDVFGIESKEFVLMSWVIGKNLEESHSPLTSAFGEELVKSASMILPQLNNLVEEEIVHGLNPNRVRDN